MGYVAYLVFLLTFFNIDGCLGQTETTSETTDDICNKLGDNIETHEVVIIGAGLSGLVAARRLYMNNSITNLTIIEARDRIGGRIYTVKEGDGLLEIGAQFIHGTDGNDVYTFAHKHQLYVSENDIDAEFDEYYTEDGTKMDSNRVATYQKIISDLIKEVYNNEDYEKSFGNQLKELFDERILEFDPEYDLKKSFLDHKLRELGATLGEEVEKESLEQELDYFSNSGPDLQMANGYYRVPAKVLEGMPTSLIQGLSKVYSIYWKINCPEDSLAARFNGHGAVRLANNRIVVGKYILCTIPLGVLKAEEVVFVPDLASAGSETAKKKSEAISNIGMACLNKHYLKWSQRWWPNTTDAFNVLWKDENTADDGIRVNRTLYNTSEDALWYRKTASFNSFYAQPTMLQSWAYGKWASLVEKLPDSEVQSVLMQLLRKGAGRTYRNAIPEPIKVFTTRWCSDEFTYGTYSYLNTNGGVEDIRNLAAPLPSEQKPVLLFAGEATEPSQWSTVHSAWKSGAREADRIIQHRSVE